MVLRYGVVDAEFISTTRPTGRGETERSEVNLTPSATLKRRNNLYSKILALKPNVPTHLEMGKSQQEFPMVLISLFV